MVGACCWPLGFKPDTSGDAFGLVGAVDFLPEVTSEKVVSFFTSGFSSGRRSGGGEAAAEFSWLAAGAQGSAAFSKEPSFLEFTSTSSWAGDSFLESAIAENSRR